MTAMEARLSGKMDSFETSVKANKDTIVLLTDSVNKNTVDLARLESQMRSADENFESKVTEVVRNMVGSDQAAPLPRLGSGSSSSTRNLTHEQVTRYWRCRRSLRVWPIEGLDLEAAVYDFLERNLDLDSIGTISVRRVVEPRYKIKNEVVVEFETAPLRDSIKALGFKLE